MSVCGLCGLPVYHSDDKLDCACCNTPLPCETWKGCDDHRVGYGREQCGYCEEYVCSYCFDDESQLCETCQ